MEIRDIEYFAAVARHGHIGRAAEALGLGQPALSMSLRRLEKSAQAKLVKRTPRGIELTAIGSALVNHARRLQVVRNDLALELNDLVHGRIGHLRIGTSTGNSELALPEACAALLREAPKVTLTVSVLDNDALFPGLRNGDVDLAVTHTQRRLPADISQERVREDEFIVYCAASHRLAKRRSVAIADLVEERWAATPAAAYTSWRALPRVFEEHGLDAPRIAFVSESGKIKQRVVASSNLLGFGVKPVIQAVAAELELTILPVKDLSWQRTVAVAYRKDGYLCPVARRFISILKGETPDCGNERVRRSRRGIAAR